VGDTGGLIIVLCVRWYLRYSLSYRVSGSTKPSQSASGSKKGLSTFDGWVTTFTNAAIRGYTKKHHLASDQIPTHELSKIQEEAKAKAARNARYVPRSNRRTENETDHNSSCIPIRQGLTHTNRGRFASEAL